MSAPLVSVLVPCFNAERWVAATLESVLAQTWPAVEIIVVVDGATDGSLAVARSYEDRGVRVLTEDRRGAAAARNRAFAEASGDVIQFLDADDILAPDKIERQMRVLAEHPGCVVCCEWGRFQGDASKAVFRREPVWSDMDAVEWLKLSWLGGGMMFPGAWLVPADVVRRAGAWDESVCLNDDGEFSTRAILASAGVRFAEGARVCYRSGTGGNQSAQKTRRALESGLRVCELCTQHMLAREDTPASRTACAALFQRFACDYYPDAPDLVARAEARARELGGSDLRPGGGPLFKAIMNVAGWKAAKRVQRIARSFAGR